jgi:hypothetical protein
LDFSTAKVEFKRLYTFMVWKEKGVSNQTPAFSDLCSDFVMIFGQICNIYFQACIFKYTAQLLWFCKLLDSNSVPTVLKKKKLPAVIVCWVRWVV